MMVHPFLFLIIWRGSMVVFISILFNYSQEDKFVIHSPLNEVIRITLFVKP